MNLNELSAVSPQKIAALREKIARLGVNLELVDEKFIRGSGKGGQKINKTSSTVQLRYPPLGLSVRCQRERQRSLNRFIALRELVDEIEIKISPETSARLKEFARLHKRKASRRLKALKNAGHRSDPQK